jgi:hypothetical protein
MELLKRISVQKLFDERLYSVFGVVPGTNDINNHTRLKHMIGRKLSPLKDLTVADLEEYTFKELIIGGFSQNQLKKLSGMMNITGARLQDDKTSEAKLGNTEEFYNTHKDIIDIHSGEKIPSLVEYKADRLKKFAIGKEDIITQKIKDVLPDLDEDINRQLEENNINFIGRLVLEGPPARMSKAHVELLEEKAGLLGLELGMDRKLEQDYNSTYPVNNSNDGTAVHALRKRFGIESLNLDS